MTLSARLSLLLLISGSLARAFPSGADKNALITAQLNEEEETFRLPNNTVPIYYTIRLTTNIHLPVVTDPEKFRFTGHVEIRIKALEATNYVRLHARQLDITEPSLTALNGDPIELQADAPEVDLKRDFITFRLQTGELEAEQEYLLSMKYNGTLRTDNQGFYRSFYVDKDGTQKWLATTQFESTDSRHGFPCYDEPNIRAQYQITIDCGLPYFAVSNMPVRKMEEVGDRLVTEFEPSRPTHPSILAFIVSDFWYVGKEIQGQVPQRIYARSEAILSGEADFALDAGVKIIRELEREVNTPYSFPKLDQVSVPDFAAGAMENWGLVTYREELFLYDAKRSSLAIKDKVATIIAHEYAHQFFGNLVSIKWWTYAWLKEGFATLFEHQATAQVYPELRDMDFFVTKQVHRALLSDASGKVRPMTAPVETPAEIAGIFDFVIYAKAGTVLRMIENAVTEKTFLKGCQYYLEEKQFQAADSNDLAAGIQKAVNEDQTLEAAIPVEGLIDSWALKSGYPIVNIRLSEDEKSLVFSQEKFSLTREESKETFWIPITYASEMTLDFYNTKPRFWLTDDRNHTVASGTGWKEGDWVVGNVLQTGYYRVNYDENLWWRITGMLRGDRRERIHHLNRAQIVDDSLNLARSGYLKYPLAFEINRFLQFERDFPAWDAANRGFDFLNRQFLDWKSYGLFKRYISDLVHDSYQTLSLEDQGADEEIGPKTMRNIVIKWACLTDDADCLRDTSKKVEEVVRNPETEIEPNTRETVYCYGLREADETTWKAVWQRFLNTTDLASRTVLLNALGCTQNSELQRAYLLDSINSDELRTAERNRVLSSVYTNGGKSGIENAIEFLQVHHKKVESEYNPPSPVVRAVNAISELVTSQALYEKYLLLLEQLVTDGVLTEESKGELVGSSARNVAWISQYETEVEAYFKDLFDTDGASTAVVSSVLLVAAVFVRFLF